jgi:hypothetical protein
MMDATPRIAPSSSTKTLTAGLQIGDTQYHPSASHLTHCQDHERISIMPMSDASERLKMGETHVRLPFGGVASTDPARVRKPWGGRVLLILFIVTIALLFVFFPLR